MKSYIDRHNRALLAKEKIEQKNLCNCTKNRKAECPLNGSCLQDSIVYQADVIPSDQNNNCQGAKTYYGCTGRTFKKRYYDHREALNNRMSKKQTTLSKHCWELKDQNVKHSIKWSIKEKAAAYTGGAAYCDLCLNEKLVILMANPRTTLNSRQEIMSKCRHKSKYSLASIKI